MTIPSTFDLAARGFTLALFLVRLGHWLATSRRAHTQKPRTKPITTTDTVRYAADIAFTSFVYLQLLGLRVLPFAPRPAVQLAGLGLVVAGFVVSVSARRTIGANWTHAAQYQIKTSQELVTTGLYRYIRHPIYTGIFASFVGAELVASSYLVVPFFVGLVIAAQNQAHREETLLIQAFGDEYRSYMARTKRFIPYLW